MFRTRRFLFRNTVVYTGIHSSAYTTDYTDTCNTHNIPYLYVNRLPEDEPSVSKHVEDITIIKN